MVCSETGEILPEKEVNDINSDMYKGDKPPVFTIGKPILSYLEILEDVGKAVLAGLLDLINKNPVSRLPSSKYKDVSGVRKEIEKYVDDVWGLDEKPENKPQRRPVNSLPRVAMIGPKKKTKTHEEKVREKREK